jgi:hypothetical protein
MAPQSKRLSFRKAQYPHFSVKSSATPQPKQPAAPLVRAQSATRTQLNAQQASLNDLTARVEALENP